MARTVNVIDVKVTGAPPERLAAEMVAVLAFEEDVRGRGAGAVRAVDGALELTLLPAAKRNRFEAKPGQLLAVETLGRGASSRVVLVGLGPRAGADRWAAAGLEPLRLAVGQVAREASKGSGGPLAIVLPELPRGVATADAVRAAVEGALLGRYRFDRYRSTSNGEPAPGFGSLVVAAGEGAERDRAVKDSVALARKISGAVGWARDLVNLPPMDCTPSALADAARALARDAGLEVEVRGPKEIEALKMGMFLGVARGSAEPPRLVRVSWVPKGAAAKRPPLVLVGKAITFDSGGLSLKPTDSMVTMNTDMAGSAAVIGALSVVAHLAPPFPVHAVLGACENMPGGRAYKPSDILRAYDGQTVEITNTDAEGRLVLGDVLAWAVERLKPAAIVDVATLTGACMVALGPWTAGVLGPDGPAVDGVLAASRSAGEDVWRLPLVEALADNLKSDRADMKNTGERWGGAITAAMFLQKFVKDAAWAHLDIAGPSHATKERGYVAKGGTGFGIRTLVELVRGWKAG